VTEIYNEPDEFKDEMVQGYSRAYDRYLSKVPDASGVMANHAPKEGKVSILIGGGSGHYPAFCGLVGKGFADGAVIGDIFTSPSGEQVYRCTQAITGGAGVLYSYGNYTGDVMNFDMAQDRCRDEGMDVRTVLVTDDVASAPPDERDERRGIAGDFYVFKVAGASAQRGDDIDTVEELAVHANDRTRTFGVAFDGCTLPGKDEPMFEVEPGKLEIGLGIHGEPGVGTTEMLRADDLADLMVEKVLEDVPTDAGSRAAVLLNGLGSTKYEELFVLYNEIQPRLEREGIDIHEPYVDEMVTSLDMSGCSLSLMWLDDELRALHDAPAETPAFTRT